ncbi:MAG: asparagine synthetase B, partial [Flavobacteriales bacterium]|nr:asparagine synthetase B [Flavobacteriales bacterium]
GMFAFAIYDRQEKTVFAARDRFGIKPFYYYKDDSKFVFASEIQAILLTLPQKPEPDEQSIFNYLVFNGTDQTESTFFKNIKKLSHGESIWIENGEVAYNKWYDLRENLKEPFKDASEFKESLSSACGLRLRSDVPVGVCLSGGLDSSSIVSLLTQDHQKEDLATFSAVYEKGLEADESPFIDEYKDRLKNMFYITPTADTLLDDLNLVVKAHGEPLPATSPYAQFKVMQLAKGKAVVLLDGQGADEHLAGYSYFFGFYFKELFTELRLLKFFTEVFHYLKNHRSLFGLKTFLYLFMSKSLKTKIRVSQKGCVNPEFRDRFSGDNVFSSQIYGPGKLQMR